MAPALDARGTYLVTGGTGALGLHAAEWLVARGAKRLVLASRRAALDDAARARIAALEQAGVEITVAAADVSRAADVDALLERIAAGASPLRGIVHAAGVDTQQPIQTMSDEDIRNVLAPKLDGACLLHHRTRGLDLHLFVAFSSIASILGSQGRAHYAAANAALDVLAAERRRLGLPAITVNWGPWKGGGMATGPHLEQFERIGNRGLRPDEAVKALDALIARGAVVASVADIDWTVFAPIYEARRARPILAEVTREPAEAAGAVGVPAGPDWVERLRPVPPERRAAALETLLAAQVSETLGFDDPASVPLDRNFYEIGMDSLMMADLVAALKTHLGASSAALVFTQPTVSGLARASLGVLTFDPAPVPAPRLEGAAPDAPWAERLSRADAGERAGLLADLVRREVSETLGFDSPESVAVNRPFTDLGMDSLLSAELGSRLKKLLGVPAARLVFEHPTVEALSRHLLDTVAARVATVAPRAGAAPAGTASVYSAELEREAVEFQTAAWPHRDPALVPARWHWMFVESARRLGVEPQIWLHRDQGRIVAHMGAIPVRVKAGAAELQTAWFVDTMVLEDYRAQALGSRLMVEAHADQPFGLSLGQTAEMRAIQCRLGWKEVAPLQTAQVVLRAGNVLKGKLPAPFAWAAGMGVDASTALLRRLRPGRPLSSRTVDRFDERHDRLWDTVSRDIATAVVRDASYLNWKYVDQPGQDLVRLELSEGSEVRAVAIWMFRERDANYQYRRAHLVDLVAPLGDPALLRDIIASACAAPMEAGADSLLCLHIDARLTAALRACGFHLRQPSRYLLVDAGPLAGETLDLVQSPAAWFVTQGDSDIDRPW